MSSSKRTFQNLSYSYPNNGFTLLEMAIIIGVIAILSAVAIPLYLNYETRARASEPMEMFDAMREQVAIEVATRDGLMQCDNNLVDQANLKSAYMRLAIEPIALDNTDASKGYGAALHVVSKVDDNGVEGVQVTKEFYHELEKHQPEKLYPKASILTDSYSLFPVLLTDLNDPVCHGGKTPSTMTSGTASSTTTTSATLLSSQKHVVTGPQSTTSGQATSTASSTASTVTTAAAKPANDYDDPNPTPVMAAICSGGVCGLIPGRDPVSQCPADKPFAFTTISNTAGARRKSFEKGCQSKEWCQFNWWEQSSGETTCTSMDPSRAYLFDFKCHYCYKKDKGNVAGGYGKDAEVLFVGHEPRH